ncbi:MAG TPA: glutamate--tRNA ligase [Acidimicrobiales bacterium]|nr:glutamate--tRNA ligase [Acidimicrobiales bacterium]
MPPPPRVRFAPSPTGWLHVGNARTALFDWLFARHHGGTNLLRIEDTDASRNHPEWVDVIYRSLEWLGLDWDEAAKFQSASFDAHRATAEKLFRGGKAYYCDCTPDDVQHRNREAGIKTPGYDSYCADRGLGPGDGRALRFRVPDEGTLTRVDVIRGTSEIDVATIEDFVIVRANGVPLYVFANCLDDIDDRITHVIRGEDHLSNVPKQMLIRQALGEAEPVWAHLPMIVNDQRKKLSKRRDRVALEGFRDEGYLAEAMVNYLATLGWAPPSELGDELASLGAMADTFDLADVNSAPAAFDLKKLASFNGFYIRRLSDDEFVERSVGWLRSTVVEPMAPLLKERAERLPDSVAMVDFLLHREPVIELDSWEAVVVKDTTSAVAILAATLAAFDDLEAWDADSLKHALESVGEANGMKLNKAQAPVRVAVTGRRVGPPLFESLVLLGRERTAERLRRALGRLGA